MPLCRRPSRSWTDFWAPTRLLEPSSEGHTAPLRAAAKLEGRVSSLSLYARQTRHGYSSFRSFSADQRGSVASSCSWGLSLRLSPQIGQRPAQSARQRIRVGRARMVASWAQRPMSSSSSADVGAAQFRVVGPGLVDLTRLDVEVEPRRFEAAHAGPLEVDREVEAEGEAVAGARDVEPHRRRPGLGLVGLAGQLEGFQRDRHFQPLALAVGQREARQVDDRHRCLRHVTHLRWVGDLR